jgi:hypothetical protein
VDPLFLLYAKALMNPLDVPAGPLPPLQDPWEICTRCSKTMSLHDVQPRCGTAIEVTPGEWKRELNYVLIFCSQSSQKEPEPLPWYRRRVEALTEWLRGSPP